MNRRRLMRSAAAEEDIPIGVNLITTDNTISQSFYQAEYANSNVGSSYLNAVYNGFNYKRTDPIPFNSDYSYSASGLSSAGSLTQLFIDENLNILGNVKTTSASTIISSAKTLETQIGKKISFVAFSLATTGTYAWTRTA